MVTRRGESGAVSIYLLIMLVGLIFFLGLLIDLGRIRIAQNQLRKASNTAARSLLANYDPALKSGYGLFAMSSEAGESGKKDFERYLAANLSGAPGGGFCLLDFRLEDNGIMMIRPLGDTGVLKQQILDEMKYRAPVDLSVEVAGRLKGIGGLFNIFGRAEKEKNKLETIDTRLVDIRGSNRRIRDLSERRKKLRDQIREDESRLARLEKGIPKADGEVSALKGKLEDNRKLSGQIKGEIQEEAGKVRKMRDEIEGELAGMENAQGRGSPADGGVNNTEEDELDRAIADTDRFINESLTEYNSRLKQEIESSYPPGALEAMGEDVNDDSFDEACSNLGSSGEEGGNSGMEKEAQEQSDEEKRRLNLLKTGPHSQLVDSIEKNGESTVGAVEVMRTGSKLLDIINMEKTIMESRDEIFINEFVLSKRGEQLRFETLASNGFNCEEADSEYIICGSWMKALEQVWLVRFALDAPAYFVLRFKALGPVWGIVASVAVGAVQASVDTMNLLDGREIGIVEVFPPGSCRIQEVKVSYKDMLRLVALLNSDKEGKLKRIAETISKKTGADISTTHTAVFGDVTVSIRLWFLPAVGIKEMGAGPFGTVIRGGRCYITKNVEYSY